MNIEQRSNVDISIVHNAPTSLVTVRGAMVVRYRLSRGLATASSNVLGGWKLGREGEEKQQTNQIPTPWCRKNFVFVWFKFSLLVSDVGSAVIT
jgi:hypothetical protein